MPFDTAAEMGTRKVCEHSTIGLVVTTDGSISDIRAKIILRPKQRVMRGAGGLSSSPFVILLNCVAPQGNWKTWPLLADCRKKYGHAVLRCRVPNDGRCHP